MAGLAGGILTTIRNSTGTPRTGLDGFRARERPTVAVTATADINGKEKIPHRKEARGRAIRTADLPAGTRSAEKRKRRRAADFRSAAWGV